MFEKYKLVRVNAPAEKETQQQPLDMRQMEKDLRNYNPTIRAMANHYGGIQDALFSKKKRNNPSPQQRLHLAAANRLRLQQLIRGHGENPMANEETQLQSHSELKHNPDVKDVVEDGTDEVKSVTLQPNLAIPARHGIKFAKLVEAASGTIGANRFGELVIRGKKLDNTSYSDVMRALYVNSNFTVPGLAETVAELKLLGVEPTLFTSRRARVLYSAEPSSRKKQGSPQQKGSGSSRLLKRKGMLRLY